MPPPVAGIQLRLFLDGYGLRAAERSGLVTRMIEFAVRDCAGLAEVKQITPESNDPTTLWILAWQTRVRPGCCGTGRCWNAPCWADRQ
jgi:hypothetical protein